MRVGFHLPTFEVAGGPAGLRAHLIDVGTAVEAAGGSWLSVMDHYFQIEGTGLPTESNMLEGYTTVGFLAKTIATLDVLSGGRAVLGIGAAWFERERQGLGIPFPPLAERFERIERVIQICKQMWQPADRALRTDRSAYGHPDPTGRRIADMERRNSAHRLEPGGTRLTAVRPLAAARAIPAVRNP